MIGIDDAHSPSTHRVDFVIVGAVYGNGHLQRVPHHKVRRDGSNIVRCIAEIVSALRFATQRQQLIPVKKRIKRMRALDTPHELQSTAHVIDMQQIDQ